MFSLRLAQSPRSRTATAISHSRKSARDSVDGKTIEDGTSSDTERGPTPPHGNGSSAPPTPKGHSADEGRGATTKKQDAALAVPKFRRPNPTRRNGSAPAAEYSTVYPASWTIAPHRNASQPSPAARPVNEPSLEPATIPLSAAVHADESDRSTSTTSQGDVGPVSPLRRQLQRKFQTISHPSPQAGKRDWRPMSVHVPTLGRMQQSLINHSYSTEHPPGPVRKEIQATPDTPGVHQSSNSNYSTIEPALTQAQRFASSTDARANRRMASTTYSQYGSEG